MILADGSCKNITNGRIKSTVVMKLTVNMWFQSVCRGLWELFMVNFGMAFSIYITADGDFCFLFMKKFICLSNLSNIHLELPVGVCIEVKHAY
jgi:hypothetical protein